MPTIQGVTVAGHSVLLPEDRLGSVTLLLLWTREHGQVSCTIANKGDGLETHWNKKAIFKRGNGESGNGESGNGEYWGISGNL